MRLLENKSIKNLVIGIGAVSILTINIKIEFGLTENFIDALLKKKEVPTGAYQYNGHSYVIYEAQDEKLAEMLGKEFDDLVFQDVVDFSEEKGGHLAVINNAEENEAIYSFVKSEELTMAFFGYTDEKKEGKWEWVKQKWYDWKILKWLSGKKNMKTGRHMEINLIMEQIIKRKRKSTLQSFMG